MFWPALLAVHSKKSRRNQYTFYIGDFYMPYVFTQSKSMQKVKIRPTILAARANPPSAITAAKQRPKNTVSHHSGESTAKSLAGCGEIGIIRVSGFGIEARSAEARAGTNDESRAYYVVSALKPCHHLSEEDDGTAAAARQLGSMSLGKSAKIEPENKGNEDAEKPEWDQPDHQNLLGL